MSLSLSLSNPLPLPLLARLAGLCSYTEFTAAPHKMHAWKSACIYTYLCLCLSPPLIFYTH